MMIEKNQSEMTGIAKTENDNYVCETSSFRLRVSYKQEELTVTIEDLVDFVVYSKVYTEGIGRGEIHKRVLLEDIFYSLTQSDFGKGQVFVLYEFGTLVKKDNVDYFKVEAKGRVTVYYEINDVRRNKKLNLESTLKLEKVKDMSEVQILKEQLLLERKKNQSLKLELGKTREKLERFVQLQSKISNVMKNETITKRNEEGYEQSIIHEVIPFSEEYTFKVKIMSADKGCFGIGIVDYRQVNTGHQFWKMDSIGHYQTKLDSDGLKYPGAIKSGVIFYEGEVVIVKVSLANMEVTWSVDGVKIVKHTSQILADKDAIFMPYIEMLHKGTELKWDYDS